MKKTQKIIRIQTSPSRYCFLIRNVLLSTLVLNSLFISNTLSAQNSSRLLDSIVHSTELMKKVVLAKKMYRPQIIFTQINRDAANRPTFKNHTYLLDSNQYFYCASLVKLPCSILALEKINTLAVPGLNRKTTMYTDSAWLCQKNYWVDSSSVNGLPSLEQHIKKMLLVSDNQSFGRVFEFLNPVYIQQRMAQLGYPRARIVHRLEGACVGAGNKHVNPIRFVNDSNWVIYSQPGDSLLNDFKPTFEKLLIGRNLYNKRKRLISESKDFSRSNYLSLSMIHSVLQNLVFNAYSPESKQFKITNDDWQFLMKHLGMYPRESVYPYYPSNIYYDSFKKYFIYGSTEKVLAQDTVRIFNIVGRAYGFLIDCAYIVNLQMKTEFLLSSVIYVNKRNSFGSGKYEYDAIGLPFLKELSLALYAYESKRKKNFLPDLESVNLFKTP